MRVVKTISEKLVERGHEVVVYTSNFNRPNIQSETEHSNEVVVHFFRNVKPSVTRRLNVFVNASMIQTVREQLRSFDIIHLHEYRTFQNIVLHHYATKYGVPYVLQAHGSLPRIVAKQRLKWIYDVFCGYRLLRDASKVTALSQVEAQQYRDMGVPEEKIEVIPNGINLSEYTNLPHKGFFKKKFSIDGDEKIILYLGRIHKIKGIDFLVKAYAYLTKNMRHDDAILVIAGPDDGYLREVKSLVNSLGLNNKLLFVGPLYGRDKLKAYVDADLYVLPSRYETFPVAVLEAYACGKPVIASRVGGLKDLVINGVTGLLVEPGDVHRLANFIRFLLNDDERAEEMGLRGKQLVKENFTVEKVVDRLENLYRDIGNCKN